MANIQDFLANFQGGGARPNRYEVILTFPDGVPGAQDASRKIGFTCKASAVPSTNIGIVEVPYMGRMVKIPGDKVWDDWTCTILLDNDLKGRKVFETWHEMLLGFRSNVAQPQMVNPNNAFASAEVVLLDRADGVLAGGNYLVEGIFPQQVSEVTLGYDQNDQIMEQTVTFAINGWWAQ